MDVELKYGMIDASGIDAFFLGNKQENESSSSSLSFIFKSGVREVIVYETGIEGLAARDADYDRVRVARAGLKKV